MATYNLKLQKKNVPASTVAYIYSLILISEHPIGPLNVVISICRWSVVGAPVAVVTGHETTGDEEDEVHKPPDAKASKGQQLPHSGPSVAKTEAVNAKTTQEEGIQQCGDEVVTRVLDAGNFSPEELSGSSTFDVVQSRADHLSVIHLLLRLTSPPYTAVA